ncbi:MAG: hypothetical protein LBG16_03685 [Elusimicrobiota bacterium]|nr:hypothetical protein [Elusimicrobiota bacterium]
MPAALSRISPGFAKSIESLPTRPQTQDVLVYYPNYESCEAAYTVLLDKAITDAGKIYCESHNNTAEKVCESMGVKRLSPFTSVCVGICQGYAL